jgi:hypothetical protein
VQEGLASALVFEEKVLDANLGEFPDEPVKMTLADIEAALEADNNKQRARFAYYNAYRMVTHLDEVFGRDKLEAMVTALADGENLEEATRSAYGISYDELTTRALEWPDPHEE